MNLEIASRLVGLRKANNLSQEALAEKLGISRQAVSKWERAEASPDTDNLIALAKLYHISLDELLKIHEEEDRLPGEAARAGQESTPGETGLAAPGLWQESEDRTGAQEEDCAGEIAEEDPKEEMHIGFDGIHVNDKDAEVHITWHGIHVYDKEDENEVHIDKHGIRVSGDEAEEHIFCHEKKVEFPLGLIALVAYIVMGAGFGWWKTGWLVFLLVPIIDSLISAVRRRNASQFCYPVLALLFFLYMGLVRYVWHPSWVVFLTIPIYYSLVDFIKSVR